MKKKILIPALVSLILLIVFFAITILSKIYNTSEIPIQAIGAFLGAIVTAFITMMLLLGQSEAEELKERNVRVFEEKTNRYNKFIDSLWNIWEDRKVTMEELNDLIKAISKDIILYTNKTTVDNILTSLTKISDLADKEQTNKEEKMLIQSEIFNIINLLAKELNLGGEISKEMLVKLNKLENSIVPYLNIKTYKPLFISALNDKINNGELPFKKAEIAYWVDGEYVFIEIEETPICVIAGPILKSDPGLSTIIGLYIDYYKFPEYWDYRDASRGWRKDMLKGFWTNPINFVDFSNVESLNNFIEKFHSSNEQENPIDILFSKIEEFYKQWTFEGKSVQDITEICIKNKS